MESNLSQDISGSGENIFVQIETTAPPPRKKSKKRSSKKYSDKKQKEFGTSFTRR